MHPQRTARRRRASKRAQRVAATVDRTTGGAAYPVRVAELAVEYGSTTRPASPRSGVRQADGEFDSPTEVRTALARLTDSAGARAEATVDEREQS